MTRTIEFVYYLLWVGVLIGALRLAEVPPWAQWMAMIAWPILIGVSIWFIGSTQASAKRQSSTR
jgi:membrane protein implicated in regulation of membrane protease activity